MRYSAARIFLLVTALLLMLASPSVVDAQRRLVSRRRQSTQRTQQQIVQTHNSKRRVKRRNSGGGKGSTEAFDAYTENHSKASGAASSGGTASVSTRKPTLWFIFAGILLVLLAAGIAYWAVTNRRGQKDGEADEVETTKKSKLLDSGGMKTVSPSSKRPWWKFGST
ncbi:hypothetical protein IV203_012071 [Nitzschia inconspicua]|uniref:Transmembrane protein n=1 Tax=Nitzschia inconspicua TaxID=303405 RepID=A0A9K3KT14_9STRA|nr:hypothetical protein IV203_012071 [Nitzschia inconspicua]